MRSGSELAVVDGSGGHPMGNFSSSVIGVAGLALATAVPPAAAADLISDDWSSPWKP